FFFSSRRRHTRSKRDWSSDVCSSDLNSVIGQKAGNSCSSGFDPAKNVLLNAAAFTVPGPGQFGTSAQILPNARNCPVYNEDFGRSEERRVGKEGRCWWCT